MSIDAPTKEEVKHACELLNSLFENYQKHAELTDFASITLSETTLANLPRIRKDAKKPGRYPDVQARIVE